MTDIPSDDEEEDAPAPKGKKGKKKEKKPKAEEMTYGDFFDPPEFVFLSYHPPIFESPTHTMPIVPRMVIMMYRERRRRRRRRKTNWRMKVMTTMTRIRKPGAATKVKARMRTKRMTRKMSLEEREEREKRERGGYHRI